MNTFGLVLLMIIAQSGTDVRVTFQSFENMRRCEEVQHWMMEQQGVKYADSRTVGSVTAHCFLQ